MYNTAVSTPRTPLTPGMREPETPHSQIDPIDFFNAWKVQSNLPYMVMIKVSQIVGEYFKLKPELQKKQNQMKILFKYNQKLVKTVEEFIAHEKKVVQKYNALTKMYIDSFQQYCSSKNMDLNFNIKPLKCVFERVRIGDWKFQIEEEHRICIDSNYQQLLAKVISKYFMNGQTQLQKLLKEAMGQREINSPEEKLLLSQIKVKIGQLNALKVDEGNMFDILQKFKEVEAEIRDLKTFSSVDQQFINAGTSDFLDEIEALHRQLFEVQPQKLKDYLTNQTALRKKFKKKHRKMKDTMQTYFQRIQTENLELKEDLDIQRRKREEAERDRNQYKSKYQYLNIKGANVSRRQKTLQSFDGGEDTFLKNTDNGVRDTSRPNTLRLSELQSQIKQLKTNLTVQENENKKNLSEIKALKASQQEIRLKVFSRMGQLGFNQEDSVDIGDALDGLFQKLIKQSLALSRKDSKRSNSEVKIQSGMAQISKDEGSINEINFSLSRRQDKETLSSSGKKSQNQKRVGEHRFSFGSEQSNNMQIKTSKPKEEQSKKKGKINNMKKTPSRQCIEVGLLEISEQNAMEEQSKNIDISKQIRQRQLVSSAAEISQKNQAMLKDQHSQALTRTIGRLREENISYCDEIARLKREIQSMESKANDKIEKAEKEKMTNARALTASQEGQIRLGELKHTDQIQTICQGIAKELNKLQGLQFSRMMSNMQDLMTTCRLGEQSTRKDDHLRGPMLSKEEDDIMESEYIANQKGKQSSYKYKLHSQTTQKDERSTRSMRLTLASEKIKFNLLQDKSLFFRQPVSEMNKPDFKIPSVGRGDQTSFQLEDKKNESFKDHSKQNDFDPEDFLQNVGEFQRMTLKNPKNMGNSQSLKLSKSQYCPSKYVDMDYVTEVERKLQQFLGIQQNYVGKGDSGVDLYWFYQKYKQAMESLRISEGIINRYKMKQQICLNKLTAEEKISRNQLTQKIFVLQQEVSELRFKNISQKEEYQTTMTEQLESMQDLKSKALEALTSNFFTYNNK